MPDQKTINYKTYCLIYTGAYSPLSDICAEIALRRSDHKYTHFALSDFGDIGKRLGKLFYEEPNIWREPKREDFLKEFYETEKYFLGEFSKPCRHHHPGRVKLLLFSFDKWRAEIENNDMEVDDRKNKILRKRVESMVDKSALPVRI